ncbi:peptidylprolyl isomerase [Agaribacterium sp. ZY112]|uniref:peptidylprolyl isomerase n=1 Tax=Agaribacterium sp. ZY112 TaxID=3233574 RepID=UPI003524B59A
MKRASARHILVKTKSEAEKLKQQLAQGADFGTLARKHSQCPSKREDGNLGEFSPGQMVKAFDSVVFNKPILTVHGPIKTQFGYHLIETIYRD